MTKGRIHSQLTPIFYQREKQAKILKDKMQGSHVSISLQDDREEWIMSDAIRGEITLQIPLKEDG